MTQQVERCPAGHDLSELVSYLDGAMANKEMVRFEQRIEECEWCKQELTSLATVLELFAGNNNIFHPSSEDIYQASLPHAQITHIVRDHLRTCAECRAELELATAFSTASLPQSGVALGPMPTEAYMEEHESGSIVTKPTSSSNQSSVNTFFDRIRGRRAPIFAVSIVAAVLVVVVLLPHIITLMRQKEFHEMHSMEQVHPLRTSAPQAVAPAQVADEEQTSSGGSAVPSEVGNFSPGRQKSLRAMSHTSAAPARKDNGSRAERSLSGLQANNKKASETTSQSPDPLVLSAKEEAKPLHTVRLILRSDEGLPLSIPDLALPEVSGIHVLMDEQQSTAVTAQEPETTLIVTIARHSGLYSLEAQCHGGGLVAQVQRTAKVERVPERELSAEISRLVKSFLITCRTTL